jgi:hypothetical protein
MKPRPPQSDSTSSDDLASPEDARLVAFFKQHPLSTPPATPDLEDAILQDIHQLQAHTRKSKSKVRWLVAGAAIAATSLTTWAIAQQQTQIAQDMNDQQLVQLQAFIEQSWDGVYTSDEEWVDDSNR